jgi:hypothetical protein
LAEAKALSRSTYLFLHRYSNFLHFA